MTNNINFDERFDPRTYHDYLKLKDVNTKPFLMLAELIDNSISSFDKEYGDHWQEQLQIKININFSGDEKNIFGMSIISGSSIEVTDNAFGMDRNTLISAVKLNRKIKSTSKMNVHGRGLKQCAFFFGVDLTVMTTNQKNESNIVKLKTTEQTNVDEPIFINPEKDILRTRGTTILIENIHEDKVFSKSTAEKIITALQFRYIKYLATKKVSIVFNLMGEFIKTFEEPNEPKIALTQAFSADELDIKDPEKYIETTWEAVKKRREREASKIDWKVTKDAFNEIAEIFRRSKSNNQELFQFSMQFILDNKVLDVDFWMLPHQNATYRGIRLFEGERAINHCGYQDQETKPYMGWKNSSPETGSTENRFAGKCDLSQLGLLSKTDKSSFTIPDSLKEELDKKIYSVWVAFNSFVMKTRDFVRNTKTKPTSQSTREDLVAIFKGKFPNENIEILEAHNQKKDETSIQYTSKNGKLWKISIKDNNSIRPTKIFNNELSGDEELNVEVFSSHPFFNKINELNEFFIEALIPIAVLFSIQYIESIDKNDADDTFDLANKGAEIFNDRN